MKNPVFEKYQILKKEGYPDNQSWAIAFSMLDDTKKKTNFPLVGDNKPITFSNSNYPLFDPQFALGFSLCFPEIWEMGGTEIANEQFESLIGAVQTDKLSPKQKKAILRREKWAPRHFKNFRLPGIIALAKWLVVGKIGPRKMKMIMIREAYKRK